MEFSERTHNAILLSYRPDAHRARLRARRFADVYFRALRDWMIRGMDGEAKERVPNSARCESPPCVNRDEIRCRHHVCFAADNGLAASMTAC
jgi:hypothetical protein